MQTLMQTLAAKLTRLMKVAFLCLYLIYAGSPLACVLDEAALVNQETTLKFDLLFVSKVMKTAQSIQKAINFPQTGEGLKKAESVDRSFFIEKKRTLIRADNLLQLLAFFIALFTIVIFTFKLLPRIAACSSFRGREIVPSTAAGYRHCWSGIAPPLAFLS